MLVRKIDNSELIEQIRNDKLLKKREFLNNYITYRRGFGIIDRNGQFKSNYGFMLGDSILDRHIEGTQGVAIRNNKVSKYLCFDIDCKPSLKKAKEQAKNIIDVLLNKYDIPSNSIILSYSGNKGYHIDLLFSTPIRIGAIALFMDIVLSNSEMVEGVHIDKRGGNHQLLKLPLGIHQSSKNYCAIVPLDFSEMYDVDYVPVPCLLEPKVLLDIVEKSKTIKPKKATVTTGTVATKTKTPKTTALHKSSIGQLEKILEEQRLLVRGTRNGSEFLLALYGNTQGMDKEETTELIDNILSNTPSELFNDDISHKKRMKMAIETIDNVYENNLRLYGKTKNKVKILDGEIRIIFENCKTINEMNVALIHLINSKKYGGTYYVSGESLAEETDLKRNAVIKINDKLIENNLIEKTSKGGISDGVKIANTYKCNIEKMGKKNSEKHFDVDVSSTTTIQNISKELFTNSEIRLLTTRRVFENFR